jgi:hypothetical protein
VTLLQSVPSFHGLQEGPFQVIDVSSLLSPLISSPWISNRQGHRPLEVQRLIEGPEAANRNEVRPETSVAGHMGRSPSPAEGHPAPEDPSGSGRLRL